MHVEILCSISDLLELKVRWEQERIQNWIELKHIRRVLDLLNRLLCFLLLHWDQEKELKWSNQYLLMTVLKEEFIKNKFLNDITLKLVQHVAVINFTETSVV